MITFGHQDLWDIAECFHTALRKCCDSSPTSAAWNIIYLKDNGVDKYWVALRDAIEKLERGKSQEHIKKVLAPAVKQATNKFDWYGQTHAQSALGCVFRCFSDEDWACYCSFMEYLPVLEEKTDVKSTTKKVSKKIQWQAQLKQKAQKNFAD